MTKVIEVQSLMAWIAWNKSNISEAVKSDDAPFGELGGELNAMMQLETDIRNGTIEVIDND